MIPGAAALLVLAGVSVAEAAPITALPPGEGTLAFASAEARTRLPEFVAALRGGAGEKFFLKAWFETWAGGKERLWLEEVRLADEGFTGLVTAIPPPGLPGLRRGERVLVEEEQVEDWTILHEGRVLGAFSHDALDLWMRSTAR